MTKTAPWCWTAPALFTGRISSFQSGLDLVDSIYQPGVTVTHSDAIIEDGVSLASISTYTYSGTSSGGTLTVQERNGSAFALNFLGNYTTGNFVLADMAANPVDPASQSLDHL